MWVTLPAYLRAGDSREKNDIENQSEGVAGECHGDACALAFGSASLTLLLLLRLRLLIPFCVWFSFWFLVLLLVPPLLPCL